jgi:hypothetical protein
LHCPCFVENLSFRTTWHLQCLLLSLSLSLSLTLSLSVFFHLNKCIKQPFLSSTVGLSERLHHAQ